MINPRKGSHRGASRPAECPSPCRSAWSADRIHIPPPGQRPIAPGRFLMYPEKHVSQPTEERTGLLLYVLYVCVFWRGEAEQLA